MGKSHSKTSQENIDALIPHFHGDPNENVNNFVCRIYAIRSRYMIKDETLKIAVVKKLSGRAQEWFHARPDIVQLNLQQFLYTLQAEFKKTEVRSAIYPKPSAPVCPDAKKQQPPPIRYRNGQPETRLKGSCFACGSGSHQIKECPTKATRAVYPKPSATVCPDAKQQPPPNRYRNGQPETRLKGSCFACGSGSHQIKECPTKATRAKPKQRDKIKKGTHKLFDVE